MTEDDLRAENAALKRERDDLKAANKLLEKDSGFAARVMDAIRRYSEGDPEGLSYMKVPWVDVLLGQIKTLKDEVEGVADMRDRAVAALEKVKGERDELRRLAGELAGAVKDALESWSFGSDQHHTHTWHDRADWIGRNLAAVKYATAEDAAAALAAWRAFGQRGEQQ